MTLYWSHNKQNPQESSCIQNCLNITEPTSTSWEDKASWKELIPNYDREVYRQGCRGGAGLGLMQRKQPLPTTLDKETSEKQEEWSE